MKLNISKTIVQEVTLSDKDVDEVTRARLLKMIYPGEYLRTGDDRTVVKQDDPYHRHGSIREVYVRDATELDIAVFRVLGALK